MYWYKWHIPYILYTAYVREGKWQFKEAWRWNRDNERFTQKCYCKRNDKDMNYLSAKHGIWLQGPCLFKHAWIKNLNRGQLVISNNLWGERMLRVYVHIINCRINILSQDANEPFSNYPQSVNTPNWPPLAYNPVDLTSTISTCSFHCEILSGNRLSLTICKLQSTFAAGCVAKLWMRTSAGSQFIGKRYFTPFHGGVCGRARQCKLQKHKQ